MKLLNTFQKLGPQFCSPSTAADFVQAQLVIYNKDLAQELGLKINESDILEIFTGRINLSEHGPISKVYAAHQFGHFVPILGDGRAMLLSEIESNGKIYDIQLKGAGPTQYSRRGDGLSALGPVLREYLVSEYMNRIGIKSTRGLCAIRTNSEVYRENIIEGGIFTRVALSHIRIGTFQYFFAKDDIVSLRKLLNYSIDRLYPEVRNVSDNMIALQFLNEVIKAQADLVASWMSIGFIHGVMNTDNMAISGETIDYGPCAYMDFFEYNKVYSFIDKNGRYAFSNQPKILMWNLARLADTLIPIVKNDLNITQDAAIELLNQSLTEIPKYFEDAYFKRMAKKFALVDSPNVRKFVDQFIKNLAEKKLDYTTSFVNWRLEQSLLKDEWRKLLNMEEASAINLMNKINPKIIPRNHLIEEVIEAAYKGDLSSFYKMESALSDPYSDILESSKYFLTPSADQVVKNTFCGT